MTRFVLDGLMMTLMLTALLTGAAVAASDGPPVLPNGTDGSATPSVEAQPYDGPAAQRSLPRPTAGRGLSILWCSLLFALFGLWLWALVDCLQRDFHGNDKVVWIIVLIFLNVLGAMLYLAIGRRHGARA